MEFGLDQLRTGLRPAGSSRFELSRFSTCRDRSNLLEPGRRPVSSRLHTWSQTCSELEFGLSRHYERARASRSATSLGPVCDQDSIMEFGIERFAPA